MSGYRMSDSAPLYALIIVAVGAIVFIASFWGLIHLVIHALR